MHVPTLTLLAILAPSALTALPSCSISAGAAPFLADMFTVELTDQ